MRRSVGLLVALVAAAVLLLVSLPAQANHAIGVYFAGPVTAGEELVLSCPVGYTAGAEPASFYRDPQGRVLLPGYESVQWDRLVEWPGGGVMSVVWNVPKGARYATTNINCFPMVSFFNVTAECVFDGSQWIVRYDYSILNASSTDFFGTAYYRIDGGERQGGHEIAVPAGGRASGSFEVLADPTAEHIVVIEYATTTGSVFDTGPSGHLLLTCPTEPPPSTTIGPTTTAGPTTTLAPTTTAPPTSGLPPTTTLAPTTTVGPTTTTAGPTTTMARPTTTLAIPSSTVRS